MTVRREGGAVTEFDGFKTDVREWFRGLEADNSKEYFGANRQFFETAIRGQIEALLDELSEKFGGEVKVFRQNRDIRFSPDKSPYKTNTYGVLHGPGVGGDGLYASISATGLVAGSGYHVMARDQLERFRDAITDEESGPELEALVASARAADLEIWGETLATTPRGYPQDHPRIELLRRKSLALGARLEFGRGISRTDGLQFVTATWRAAMPVTRWLDEHVGASENPTYRGRRRR